MSTYGTSSTAVSSTVQLLGFYADPGPLTKAVRHSELLRCLPAGLRELTQIIHGLAIYDVVAPDFYGVRVPESRAGEIHHRRVDDMLTSLLGMNEAELASARVPAQRLFCRCGGFTRLLVAVLRSHGVPARARCGFAAYFNPGHFQDHWLGEVWDTDEERWRLVDAQLDEVWRSRSHIEEDVLDVPRDRFLVAADAWQRCRAGDDDPRAFGITFAGLHGLWFIAGNLVRDLAALNKVEMLPWDVWGAHPPPGHTLDEMQLTFFDELAGLIQDPDTSFDRLRHWYATDGRLRVPPTVFNALRQREELVA